MPLIKNRIVLFLILSILATKMFAQRNKILFNYAHFDVNSVSGYEYVVVEDQNFSKEEIEILKKNNTYVIAYLSFGEINKSATNFPLLKKYTKGENHIWDSFILDLSNAQTRIELINQSSKLFYSKGYDGLFMDNIDNYTAFGPSLEELPYLISLLKEIKFKIPRIKLIQNAGLEILPVTNTLIDALVVESVITDYSFENKTYRLSSEVIARERLETLNIMRKRYDLDVILVEYATSEAMIKRIKEVNRKFKFRFFIGEIELQKLPNDN